MIAGGAVGSAASGTVSLSPPADEVWSQSGLRESAPAGEADRGDDVMEEDSVADVTLPAVARAPAADPARAVDRLVSVVGRSRSRRHQTALPLAAPPLRRAASVSDSTLSDPTLSDPTLPDPTLPDPTLPDPTIESPPPHAHASAGGPLLVPAVHGRARWTRLAVAGGGVAVVVGLILALWLGGGRPSQPAAQAGGAKAGGAAAGAASDEAAATPTSDEAAAATGDPAHAALAMSQAAARPGAGAAGDAAGADRPRRGSRAGRARACAGSRRRVAAGR